MKKNILLFLVGCTFSMHAYIYQAIVMKKWKQNAQRYHYFIGLGDFHNKKHPVNAEHRQQLQALFGRMNQDTTKILTEDLSVPNVDGHFSSNGFFINSRGGVLGGLTETCHDFGIHADNLEYRYARVCALGPILNNLKENPFDFISTSKIRIADLAQEIDKELESISSFHDGSQLNSWYKEHCQKIKKNMYALGWHACSNATVAEYISCVRRPMLPVLNRLLTFDASILDIKIVHEIVNNSSAERICAIAGGSHIDRASKALKKIGYTSVFETKPIFQRETSIDAGGSARSSKKPQAISVDALQRFF
jgi:hypothetical protein